MVCQVYREQRPGPVGFSVAKTGLLVTELGGKMSERPWRRCCCIGQASRVGCGAKRTVCYSQAEAILLQTAQKTARCALAHPPTKESRWKTDDALTARVVLIDDVRCQECPRMEASGWIVQIAVATNVAWARRAREGLFQ